MQITKLEKEANYIDNTCKIKVEISIDLQDLASYDYTGLDMIPDETLPDILTAVGRMYKGKIKQGKILKEKVGSLLP